ncbi:arrestin domain-containing protein 2-like [Oratosquilla oratoria]|uniref:arrestin domain-containing protein 2-like n=1 Tax=Oratosquilla oratoria TaxID=337810 RepID=UPI003F7700E1
MDYIREFDIRLEREMYYAGEVLQGQVILDAVENFKLRAIRVVVRGKAHTEWKMVVSGDRRTVRDDQYFVDDRTTIWGKDKPEGNVPILPRGFHTFPFRFQLPESSLPCSFESKCGTIRYYIKVTVDIPYASPPQGMKYFTVIGPHIDCMDDQYLKPMVGQDKRALCCLCCRRGPVALRTQLERTAYVCGESIKLKADIDNQSEEEIRLRLKLMQYVEYFLDRGVLGVSKDEQHAVLEYTGDPVPAGTRWKFDSTQSLVVPVMPPTLVGVCRLIQIYYVLKVNIVLSRSGEDLHMHFPITIATVPFRIPNSQHPPNIIYSPCCDHVEGGMYIGPEFQLGQVYDGMPDQPGNEPVVLYRPVYVAVPNPQVCNTPSARSRLLLDPNKLGGRQGDFLQLHQQSRSTTSTTRTTTASNTFPKSSNASKTTVSSSATVVKEEVSTTHEEHFSTSSSISTTAGTVPTITTPSGIELRSTSRMTSTVKEEANESSTEEGGTQEEVTLPLTTKTSDPEGDK